MKCAGTPPVDSLEIRTVLTDKATDLAKRDHSDYFWQILFKQKDWKTPSQAQLS